MTKLLAVGVAIGLSFFSFTFTPAQSMPFATLDGAQSSLTIPVAGGCGPGFHRGPYGGCRRNGYYGGTYYGGGAVVVPGVAVVPPVVVAPRCRRVCNPYRCWTAC